MPLGEGWSAAAVCQAFAVCRTILQQVRARFATGGVEAVLTDKRQALTTRRSRARSKPISLWCVRAEFAEFVEATQNVLDLDNEPYDPTYLTVCLEALEAQPVLLHTQTR